MRPHTFLAIAAAPALLLVPALHGQDRGDRWDPWAEEDAEPPIERLEVAFNAGLLFSTDWSDAVTLGTIGATTGTFQQVLLRQVSVAPAPTAEVALTYWRDRVGLRLHAGFSRSCLAVGPACIRASDPVDGEPFVPPESEIPVNTWVYGASGVFQLLPARARQVFRPYVILGIGGVTYDPDAAAAELLPRFIREPGVPTRIEDGRIVVVIDETTTFLLAIDELGLTTVGATVFGAGADVGIPIGTGGVRLRGEVSNHSARSPLRVRLARIGGGLTGDAPVEQVTMRFDPVQNIRLLLGLTLEFGLRGSER